ncbi:MAG: ABC transporter permease [Tissierellia bacterium]|nr:ABC transporter permease [Tissierellia bacterium]
MNIYDEYIKNSLKKDRKKIWAIKLTILLATLSLTIFILFMNTLLRNKRELALSSFGDFHAGFSVPIDAKKAEYLEKNVNIKKLGFSKTVEDLNGTEGDFTYLINFSDENFLNLLNTKLIRGELPKAENEILIPFSLVEDLNIDIGDYLEMEKDGIVENYQVCGLYDYSYFTWDKEISLYSFSDTEKIKSNSNSVIIWFKDIKKTYELTPEIFSHISDLDFENAFNKGIVKYNFGYLSSRLVKSDMDYSDSFADRYPKIIVIGSIVILLFTAILIKNIFTTWENEYRREYGLLLSIGATKLDLIKLMLKRLYKLAIKPIILGLISGIIIDFLLVKIVNHYFLLSQQNLYLSNVQNMKFTFSWWALLLIILFTVSLIIIVSLSPLRKVLKLNPTEAIYIRQSKPKKKLKIMKLNGKSFISDLNKIINRDNRFKNILLIATMAMSIFIFAMALTLSSGLDLDMEYNSLNELEYYDYKIDYWNSNKLSENTLSEIRRDYAKELLNFRTLDLYLENSKDYNTIFTTEFYNSGYENYQKLFNLKQLRLNIMGIDREKFAEIISEYGLKLEDFKDNQAIVINSFPDNLDLPLKSLEYKQLFNEDINRLYLNEFSENSIANEDLDNPFEIEPIKFIKDREILKVPIMSSMITVLMPMDNFFEIADKIIYASDSIIRDSIFIKSNGNRDYEDLKSYIENKFNTRNVEINNRETINAFTKNSNKMLYSILYAAALISGIVGLSASYGATENNRLNRQKDYALYQIVGMDNKMLKKLVRMEVNKKLIMLIITAIIAVIVAAAITKTAYKPFGIFQIIKNMNLWAFIFYIIAIAITLYLNNNRYLKNIDLAINQRMI